jgi:hypothetical protein
MPGLGSVPVPVTRADVFASSDGGEAREQETCFHVFFLPAPPGCPPDWYQPLSHLDRDLYVPAPPKPDPDAQLVTKLIKRPFLKCSSDNDCGSLDVLNDTDRISFTQESGSVFGPSGYGIHVHVNFDNFTEPASRLYGFGFTLEVGWNRPAAATPKRFKVTVEKVHIAKSMDSGPDDDGEWEISALIGDTFRHLLLTGNGAGHEYNEDVPASNEINVGDYGVKGSGSDCALDTVQHDVDPGPCQKVFEVTVLGDQPLRVFFRAEEVDALATNQEAGTVERIATAADSPAYALGEHTEWFQEHTSAGDDALDAQCDPNACASITYKIAEDPLPAPPATTLSVGSPTVSQGSETWVSSASALGLTATAPSGHEGDALELHARFWRSGTNAPGESACGSGTGSASCTLHLNANDAQDGQYTLEYWALDTTTNAIEATHTATLLVDNTAPTTSAALAGTLVRGWYDTPVTVTLSATDGAGVGVGHSGYIVDPPGLLTPYSGPFDVTSDSASHTVQFSSADKLANTESAKSVSFKIDRTPPTLVVSSASDGTFSYTQNELAGGLFTNATSLAISYAASDALSGIYGVRVDGTPIGTSGTVNVSLPAGISTHKLVAEDVAGNMTTITFTVVSVPPGTFAGGVDPQGSGFWKNEVPANIDTLLAEVNVASRAFGAPDNRYDEATTSNYQSYLTVNPNAISDLKVRRELLVAWLNLVSGREPAAQTVDLKSVSAWASVVTNTGGASVTTALNLVRESERRLEQNPSDALLDTVQTLLEKLNTGKLNK